MFVLDILDVVIFFVKLNSRVWSWEWIDIGEL